MTDLRDRLRDALGPAYRIERELGGGGMSRVFVAEEVALGRRVVVKVLVPDVMPGASAARFRQEMQTAAQLQHPAIVPLLGTGAADGLTWFTMPFVVGETLRDRLQRVPRDGPLPVADVVRLGRDLFDALGAAHAAGVMHRDVKPENLFLSGRHLLVADFGVARALTVSTRGGPADGDASRLTVAGMAVGTPAYMAPEQAVGDDGADHRVDLYAAGLVLYEMLCGASPFAASTPQAMVAAHLTATPTPVAERRPETPPALGALVMRCLAKDPADRPPSAAAALDALDGVTAGSSGGASASGAPLRRRGVRLGAAAVVLLALGGAAWWTTRTPPAAGPRPLVLVGGFRHAGADAALAQATAAALRIDVGQSAEFRTPDPAHVREALRTVGQPDTVAPTDSLLADVAARLGARAYVDGEVARAGRGFVFTARVVAVDGGRELKAVRAAARDSSEVLSAIDQLSREVRRSSGESVRSLAERQPLPLVTTRSLPALLLLAEGSELLDRNRSLPAAQKFREALALDSTFAAAWRGLGIALGNSGVAAAERWAATARAFALRGRLAERERLATEGTYYSTLGDEARAAAAWRALLALDPESIAAANNLGISLNAAGEYAEAERTLAAALARRPTSALLRLNLMQARSAIGDSVGVDAVANDSLSIPRLRWIAAAEGRRWERALAIADSQYAAANTVDDRAEGFYRLSRTLVTLGRLRRAAEVNERTLREVPSDVRSSATAIVRTMNAVVAAHFAGDTARALAELRAARAADAQDATPGLGVGDAFMTIARTFALLGRPAETRAMLAEYERLTPRALRARDTTPLVFVRAALASAEGKDADAIALLREGQRGEVDCTVCTGVEIARAFDRMGNADSTLAAIDEYLRRPRRWRRYRNDWFQLAWALKRGGELSDARGDAPTALARYRELVELWRDADPSLQPTVSALRARIATLERRRG